MEPDFSGFVTKANILCSDGKVILPGAFQHQDQAKVPLVWSHGHNDVNNVLGHVILSKRSDGVWGDAYFNTSPAAAAARASVAHHDITQMSIWANALKMSSNKVVHGTIREVSLVLAGANPEARIDPLSIKHQDGSVDDLDDEAIIFTGLDFTIQHSDPKGTPPMPPAPPTNIQHSEDPTVADVIAGMTEDQKLALDFVVQTAVEEAISSAGGGGGNDMGNVQHWSPFEGSSDDNVHVISHDAMVGIIESAKQSGSLKSAIEAYASDVAHGIENIGMLFPDAVDLDNQPLWITRRNEWVAGVLGSAHKSPFAVVRTRTADLTFDEARAKGYITGNMKKEQFFAVSQRQTSPTTIYKKQKFDRDTIIDISDMDVVAWVKSELSVMLEEELARAILLGDGREVDDEDKINAEKIRPVATDDPFYTVPVKIPYNADTGNIALVIDKIIEAMDSYKGTGRPTFFTTQQFVTRARLLKDTVGRRIYTSDADLAAELRVAAVVPVELMSEYPDLIGVIVNMADYNIGANKGGEKTMFDDFDIDFNQYKYLLETRVSGALTKPKCAVALWIAEENAVMATALNPTQDKTSWDVTIPDVDGVEYVNADGVVVSGTVSMAAGDNIRINARATTGYYLASGKIEWTFLRPSNT
jgi:HK97 family phage prohead protease